MSVCAALFRRLADGALAQCALPSGHATRTGEPSAHAEYLGAKPEGLGDAPVKVRCHPTLCAQEPGHVGSHDGLVLPEDWATPMAPPERCERWIRRGSTLSVCRLRAGHEGAHQVREGEA